MPSTIIEEIVRSQEQLGDSTEVDADTTDGGSTHQPPSPSTAKTKVFRDGTELSIRKLLETSLKDEETTLRSLFEWKLLPPTVPCPKCQKLMERQSVSRPHRHPEGRFYCAECKAQYGGRCSSLFENTRGSLKERMIAVIHWFLNDEYTTQRRECLISVHTLCDLRILLNAIATVYIQTKNQRIGGLFRVVEVDEAQLHRRKYGLGRQKEDVWVLGGVERPTPMDETRPKMFLSILQNRDAASIRAALQQWVVPGTIICSDAFAGYTNLDDLGYFHFNVNHKENFVDALTHAHSQRIEGLWHHLRRSALPLTGTRSEDLNYYLAAYLFRQQVNVFEDFIDILATIDLSKVRELIETRSQIRKAQSKEIDTGGKDNESEDKENKEGVAKQRSLRVHSRAKVTQKSPWEKRRNARMKNYIQDHPAEAAIVSSTQYTNRRALQNAWDVLEDSSSMSSEEEEKKQMPSDTDDSTKRILTCNKKITPTHYL